MYGAGLPSNVIGTDHGVENDRPGTATGAVRGSAADALTAAGAAAVVRYSPPQPRQERLRDVAGEPGGERYLDAAALQFAEGLLDARQRLGRVGSIGIGEKFL